VTARHTPPVVDPATIPDGIDSETFRTLLVRAHRRTGSLAPDLVVRHVVSVTAGGDWPVRRDALDAVLRRIASAAAGDIRLVSRPPRGRAFGLYETRRRAARTRPYRTLLRGAGPIDGSCDCADFLRSSLGLCKHLVVVLGHVHSKFARTAALPAMPAGEPIRWDPVRPLTGRGDWLDRVRWTNGTPRGSLRRWIGPARPDGARVVRTPDDAKERLALVHALLPALGNGTADPALRALAEDERRRLTRELEGAQALPRMRQALRGLKQTLYPYQREGVERFLARGALLLADDMGLGKTAQAIAACHALWHTGRVRRGLLIVPAALKPQWMREWQLFTDAPIAIVEGAPADRHAAFGPRHRGFLIGNYEQLIRDLDVVRAWRPDIIVLDEAQRIKNWATKTTLAVKELDPPFRLVLTGTPMENRIDELASIVEWVDDHALEPKWRLQAWHTTFVDGRAETGGARNLDTLRVRLAGCMLRRVRQDVLPQLPARTDTRVPIEMTAEQLDEHDALVRPIAQIVQRATTRPLTRAEFLRLMTLLTTQRIISNGLAQSRFESIWPDLSRIERPTEATLRGLASPKLVELRELVDQLAVVQGRKVVVFSQWRRMLRLAHWATRDRLARAGLRAAFFTGEEGQRRRTQNIVDFHDDPACRVLFATDAGGVGLNLQRAANACINIELPWNPAVLEQRIGRIYRMGQRRPIDVYTLVSEPGIESRIADLVGAKRAVFSGLFDGTSDEVTFDRAGGFLARVERLITPAEAGDARTRDGGAPDEEAAEPAIDATIAAADESGDRLDAVQREAETEPVTAAPPSAAAVERLFAGLAVRQTPQGGLIIEAPPETAAALAALLSGMAGVLRSAP
jgi:hypothetical protein